MCLDSFSGWSPHQPSILYALSLLPLSTVSFFYCSLPKTTKFPFNLVLLLFWVCFHIFYCCSSRAESASSMHSAACRQKQCNKIFSVYWHKLSPRHLRSFALKSLTTFRFELLLWKRRYAAQIQNRTVNSRDLWQVTSATSKLSWKQQGRLGNSSQPFQHTARTENTKFHAAGYL